MNFYKFTAILNHTEPAGNEPAGLYEVRYAGKNRYSEEKIFLAATEYNQKQPNGSKFLISAFDEDRITFIAASRTRIDDTKAAQNFLKAIGLEIMDGTCRYEEIVFDEFMDLARCSSYRNPLSIEEVGLDDFKGNGFRPFERTDNESEYIVSGDSAESAKKTDSEEFLSLVFPHLAEELNRIRAGKSSSCAVGHPVHYLFTSTDSKKAQNGCNQLVESLYENYRLSSRRVTCITIEENPDFPLERYKKIYQLCQGGTVYIQFKTLAPMTRPGFRLTPVPVEKVLYSLVKLAKEYRNSVLTVFSFTKETSSLCGNLLEMAGSMKFVDIGEEALRGKEAKKYLFIKAKAKGYLAENRPNRLYKRLDPQKTYLLEDLDQMVEDWFSDCLLNSRYTQYTADCLFAAKKPAPEQISTDSYRELMEMVGLEKVKKVITEIFRYKKGEAILEKRGIPTSKTGLHMAFSGNPGTAKTTVARLLGRALSEAGFLKRGHIVEVGRADIIAKYVGQTAPQVKELFRKAEGGILFIDEAYSLADSLKGGFGDEAINTLVQEMENHRDTVIVIFAGYQEPLEEFIERNPGLRSRINYHLHFDDYTIDELADIARLMARKNHFTISEEACAYMKSIFAEARRRADFGNGRFVRNLLDRARTLHIAGLTDRKESEISDAELLTITRDDLAVDWMDETPGSPHAQMGFCY